MTSPATGLAGKSDPCTRAESQRNEAMGTLAATHTVQRIETIGHEPLRAKPSVPFYLLTFVVVAAIQLLLYWNSFQVRPSGDDFGPPLTEILRGDRLGVGVFFTQRRK